VLQTEAIDSQNVLVHALRAVAVDSAADSAAVSATIVQWYGRTGGKAPFEFGT